MSLLFDGEVTRRHITYMEKSRPRLPHKRGNPLRSAAHVGSKKYALESAKILDLEKEGAEGQKKHLASGHSESRELDAKEREELMRLRGEYARLKSERDEFLKASTRFLEDVSKLLPMAAPAGGEGGPLGTQNDDLSAWLSGLT